MNPTLHAFRAITVIVFQQLLKPVIWIVSLMIVAALGVIVYLGDWVNPWWFIFLIVVMPVGAAAAGLAILLWQLSNRLLPRRLNREERTHLVAFSHKLLHLAETRSTPIPLLIVMIARDIFRRRKSGYIENMVHDSLSLRGDFETIRRMFDAV